MASPYLLFVGFPATAASPGTEWLAALKASISFIVVSTVFTSFLIPIVIALFFFSTRHSRAQPVFYFNIMAILLGIVEGILSGYLQVNYTLFRTYISSQLIAIFEIHAILSPLNPLSPSFIIAYAMLWSFIPFLTETVLILRLLVIYPVRTTQVSTLLLIYTFPVLVKAFRLVNLSVFMVKWIALSHSENPLSTSGQIWWTSQPYVKIEWILQLLDKT